MKLFVGLAASAILFAGTQAAFAQENFPTKPVNLVVNYPAGGSTDAIARALAKAMEPELGQTVTVENIAGGSATRAVTAVVTSEPDGYTIGIASNSPLTISSHKIEGLPWGAPDTYDILGGIGNVYHGVGVQPDAPYSSIEELVKYAREHPGELRVATPGGGINQYVWRKFAEVAKIDVQMVPYAGDADSITAFLGGNTEVVEVTWPGLRPHVEAGKVKPIGIFAPERLESDPDVETFAEAGYDVTIATHNTIYAPLGLSDDVRAKLQSAIKAAVNDPDYQKVLESRGVVVVYGEGEEMTKNFTEMYKAFAAENAN